ncbi:TPA: hypothetical protein ACNBZ6_005409 [Escherichia coli]
MSKALTPSQLKAELETQKDALLKACLYALNEIPNRRLSGPYASTYALAEQVSKPRNLRAPAPTPSHLRATVAIKGSFRGAEF